MGQALNYWNPILTIHDNNPRLVELVVAKHVAWESAAWENPKNLQGESGGRSYPIRSLSKFQQTGNDEKNFVEKELVYWSAVSCDSHSPYLFKMLQTVFIWLQNTPRCKSQISDCVCIMNSVVDYTTVAESDLTSGLFAVSLTEDFKVRPKSWFMAFTEGCAHAWRILQISWSTDKQGFILRGWGSSALLHPE